MPRLLSEGQPLLCSLWASSALAPTSGGCMREAKAAGSSKAHTALWALRTQHSLLRQPQAGFQGSLLVKACCAQSLRPGLTLCDPMDCGPPGSSLHGISEARILEWFGHFLLQEIFPTQGLNPHLFGLRHWPAGSSPLAPPRKPQR